MDTERFFLMYRVRGSLYPSLYLGEFVDSHDVKMVRCKRYKIKHEEIVRSAHLKKHVSDTFLVYTDNPMRALETKYLWKDETF